MLAISLDSRDIDRIFKAAEKAAVHISVDVDTSEIQVTAGQKTSAIPFTISEFDKALVKAGGWVEYADIDNYKKNIQIPQNRGLL
ncbi:MAG: hypothetical protein U5K27_02545 [Desulfotignum sp.]|nr:hypothetical protein [Desulfotignum sp.]